MVIGNIFGNAKLRALMHLLYWGSALLFYTLFFGHQEEYYLLTMKFVLQLMPVLIATTYFFNYYLLPRLFFRNKYFRFALFALYTVVLSLYCTTFIVFSNVFRILETEGRLDRSALDVYFLVVGLYFVVVLAIAIKLFRLSYEKENQNLRLLREKTEAELELLRSQINPHFLFNTLNSIYTLAMKKSDKAPEVVLKLSEMLDYLLYETSAPRVHLNKELQLIRNYIYLQKIRFYKNEAALLNIKSDTGTHLVAPMLLLPFVENAFKHGPGKSKNTEVSINIEIGKNVLKFRARNAIQSSRDNHEGAKGGIGLSNVKKRLDIEYPDRYTLRIESNEKIFEVFLEIPLDKASKT